MFENVFSHFRRHLGVDLEVVDLPNPLVLLGGIRVGVQEAAGLEGQDAQLGAGLNFADFPEALELANVVAVAKAMADLPTLVTRAQRVGNAAENIKVSIGYHKVTSSSPGFFWTFFRNCH